VGLMNRWRQIIDKSIPRNDIMEIAWENIPAAWEQEMAALRVFSPSILS
jgi:FKBP12-rapamycin complex-associated protein